MKTPDQLLVRHQVRVVKRYNRLALKAERRAIDADTITAAEHFMKHADGLRVLAAQYGAQLHIWQEAQKEDMP